MIVHRCCMWLSIINWIKSGDLVIIWLIVTASSIFFEFSVDFSSNVALILAGITAESREGRSAQIPLREKILCKMIAQLSAFGLAYHPVWPSYEILHPPAYIGVAAALLRSSPWRRTEQQVLVPVSAHNRRRRDDFSRYPASTQAITSSAVCSVTQQQQQQPQQPRGVSVAFAAHTADRQQSSCRN